MKFLTVVPVVLFDMLQLFHFVLPSLLTTAGPASFDLAGSASLGLTATFVPLSVSQKDAGSFEVKGFVDVILVSFFFFAVALPSLDQKACLVVFTDINFQI
ncbi:hypothetical protein L6452_32913 [Arctium lappa]|uniref:Uncharacterized protein n=1 Tax=Arctium lappa TaxID=4217 RepID=A0ACB8ZAA5_ARCLA|nr:hypothetical protein L6452_32913 [Arctium lappa]